MTIGKRLHRLYIRDLSLETFNITIRWSGDLVVKLVKAIRGNPSKNAKKYQKCPQSVPRNPNNALKMYPTLPKLNQSWKIKHLKTILCTYDLRAKGTNADITGSISLTILPIYLSTNYVFSFSSTPLFKTFHMAICSHLRSWCPRWYTSISDGLVTFWQLLTDSDRPSKTIWNHQLPPNTVKSH